MDAVPRARLSLVRLIMKDGSGVHHLQLTSIRNRRETDTSAWQYAKDRRGFIRIKGSNSKSGAATVQLQHLTINARQWKVSRGDVRMSQGSTLYANNLNFTAPERDNTTNEIDISSIPVSGASYTVNRGDYADPATTTPATKADTGFENCGPCAAGP